MCAKKYYLFMSVKMKPILFDPVRKSVYTLKLKL
jgi:hypothetical protein